MSSEISFIQEFINGLKEEKILYNSCAKCEKDFMPPKPHCPYCGNKELSLKEAPKEGTIVSFTIVRVAPTTFVNEAPYVVGLVEFLPGVRIMGRIYTENIEKIKIGQKVSAVFNHEKNDPSILAFKIASNN